MAQRSLIRLPDTVKSAAEMMSSRAVRLYNTVMDGVVQPYATPLTKTTYLSLPGVTGNYASVTAQTGLAITGDIDIQLRIALTDWTPGTATGLLQKNTGLSSDGYILNVMTNGRPRLDWFATGGEINVNANATPTFTDNVAYWLRATLDVDNGASGYDVKFYTAADSVTPPATWTQLGTTVTGGATTDIKGASTALDIGRAPREVSGLVNGKIYRVRIFASLNGTAQKFDADFTAGAVGATSIIETLNYYTVTINTSGGTPAAITKES